MSASTEHNSDDWLDDFSEKDASKVNEGVLTFLDTPVDRNSLHSANIFTIRESSLQTGWVGLKQCYRNLDATGRVEIVYQYRQMEKLRIVHQQGIAKAVIVNQSIQLEDVSAGANICVQAEVRVFYFNPDGSYSLINGPYMRKFLDGYYPYYVTMEIHYPGSLLLFKNTRPRAQKGFKVENTLNMLHIKAWFEGELMTDIRFLPDSRL
ncbi:MAG: hypothetical protein OQL06_08930 [Gammaproteobacteria bacterium]|nr:hypothetical protein [Gammaproteobacteria bacterium]